VQLPVLRVCYCHMLSPTLAHLLFLLWCLQCVGHFTPTAATSPGRGSIGSDCITGVAFADDGRQVLANHLGERHGPAASTICNSVTVQQCNSVHGNMGG
jgi:hypothetical protein